MTVMANGNIALGIPRDQILISFQLKRARGRWNGPAQDASTAAQYFCRGRLPGLPWSLACMFASSLDVIGRGLEGRPGWPIFNLRGWRIFNLRGRAFQLEDFERGREECVVALRRRGAGGPLAAGGGFMPKSGPVDSEVPKDARRARRDVSRAPREFPLRRCARRPCRRCDDSRAPPPDDGR